MFVENNNNTIPPKRIYYLQRKKFDLLLRFGFLAIVLWVIVEDISNGLISSLLPVLILYLVWLYLYYVCTRAVVSPLSIELRYIFYTFRAPWLEIEQVKTIHKGSQPLDVLTLKVPRIEQKSRIGFVLFWLFEAHLKGDGEFIPVEKVIPLGFMFPGWLDSELGRDIQQYILELFAVKNLPIPP